MLFNWVGKFESHPKKCLFPLITCCCCSLTKTCLALYDPMDCSTPDFSALHSLLELTQTHVHWVSDATQPSHPLLSLLLLPPVFPSLRVFSVESVLHIRRPKYWSFSFDISPSNEYSGLISFRLVWSCSDTTWTNFLPSPVTSALLVSLYGTVFCGSVRVFLTCNRGPYPVHFIAFLV